jgi:hypothetical protein
MSMALLTSAQENAELRAKLAAAELRIFEMQVHRTYGNPGERIQVQPDGVIVRIPPPPDETGLRSVPTEAATP